jgi:RNA recognition motif-containing protein
MTTVIIRNIPAEYRQKNLRKMVDQFGLPYNFLYLPNVRNRVGHFGYAFVNFDTNSAAVKFMKEFQGCQFGRSNGPHQGSSNVSAEGALVGWSSLQGFEANVERHLTLRSANRHSPYIRFSEE